ncbi:MAG TPA: glutamate--tRNA ligase [Candidatus Eisenbacteria bacterium]|nr:glutamate--tRNA ligase [Candidatus Eisenbacteria bacterium]
MSETPVRVRFAPSPTGSLHIGGARTALFNWLFARGREGLMALRVEDTDVERSTSESERAVVDDLRWLGLDWDEGPEVGGPYGPYRQSERKEIYRREANRLCAAELAYPCFCTDEELEARRRAAQAAGRTPQYDGTCRDLDEEERAERRAEGRPESIRFRVPGEPAVVRDLIRGDVVFPADAVGDFVILRSNGLPTYNFACVVDDAAMRFTHVIRGEEHLSNTNRQVFLYRALGHPEPAFAHISLILNPDRSKMSKRKGEEATFVSEFRAQGYLPEALINFLALLGWSWDGEREMFSVEELVEKFSLERVNATPAVFNRDKLEWMNGQYLRALPLAERAARVRAYLAERGRLPERADVDEFLERATAAVGDRLKTLADVEGYAGFAFSDSFEIDPKAKEEVLGKKGARESLVALAGMVEESERFEPAVLEARARELSTKLGVKPGDLFFPARVALTGRKVAPGLFEVMSLLGRERTTRRLKAATAWWEEPAAASRA